MPFLVAVNPDGVRRAYRVPDSILQEMMQNGQQGDIERFMLKDPEEIADILADNKKKMNSSRWHMTLRFV